MILEAVLKSSIEVLEEATMQLVAGGFQRVVFPGDQG
jgi:hypothetical protein